MELYNLEDTICAVATPPGIGGISVIRLCGLNSIKIISQLCHFIKKSPESHRAYYGIFKDTKNSPIDEVIVTYFKKGSSFTGNDVFEISCHGNQNICLQIMSQLIVCGARQALKGEFTYRAFSNGRIDLVQAESVLSLIESTSKKASQLSFDNLMGHLSNSINSITAELTDILANFEANIDFSTEDIEILPVKDFEIKVGSIVLKLKSLIESYEQGNKIQNGLNLALVGLPNAGKSSLLNNLLGYDKAIVSSIPGTTRDIVEDSLHINGVKINLHDTAGIHVTDDPVEKMGVLKSIETIATSDVVVFVHDSCLSESLKSKYKQLFSYLNNKKIIFVNTKVDLDSSSCINESSQDLADYFAKNEIISIVDINNINKKGVNKLLNSFSSLVESNFSENSAIVSQARHFDQLLVCNNHLLKSLDNIKNDLSPEFIASDLHSALQALYSIVGKEYSDQVMDKVFQKFCIGK